jgi:dTMP kinase
MRETYGVVLPGMNLTDLTGRLIVIEGTDGVGRTTQINLLKPWLEQQGRAVLETGMTRSSLAGKGIKQAKEGHTLGRVTLSLFYSTDFADRLENEIVPALRAGFVVLTDRYTYSLMARALVRGVDPAWIRNAYSFALKPDVVFYLRIGVDDLIPRVVFSRGFDYWESGMDLHPSEDMYESFRKYQTDLLKQFDVLAEEYKFEVIDASADVRTVFEQLRDGVSRVLTSEPLFAIPKPKPAEEGPREAASKPTDAAAAAPSVPEAPAKEPQTAAAPHPTERAAEIHRGSAAEEKSVAQVLAKAAEGEAST